MKILWESMLSRVTKHLFVALTCPFKLGASLRKPIERNYSFVGSLYRRDFSARSRPIMEDSPQSNVGNALVAVCQMNCTSDVDRNLGICEELVRKAKSRGAKVCSCTDTRLNYRKSSIKPPHPPTFDGQIL